jgi:hypothetical protein
MVYGSPRSVQKNNLVWRMFIFIYVAHSQSLFVYPNYWFCVYNYVDIPRIKCCSQSVIFSLGWSVKRGLGCKWWARPQSEGRTFHQKIGSTNRENRGKFSLMVLSINKMMASVRFVKDLYVSCSSRCCSRSSSLELYVFVLLFVFCRAYAVF